MSTQNKAASEDALAELHSMLAKSLSASISRKYYDKEGEELPCPAAILNVARQFLKDNGIESAVTIESETFKLASVLPFDTGRAVNRG